MDIKQMRRRCLILVAIFACALVHFGNDVILAGTDEPSEPRESVEHQFTSLDKQEAIKGYPIRKRRIGGPTDVETDLDNSFPKSGSLLELILQCDNSQHQ